MSETVQTIVAGLAMLLALGMLISSIMGLRARLAYKQGLADKDEMLAKVYGPNWKDRLIMHDNLCTTSAPPKSTL